MLDGERLFEIFLRKMRIYQQETGEHVLAGRCRDHAEYRHSLGRLKAVKDCEDLAKEAYKELIGELDIKRYREITHEKEPESY
jgi:hypothetical protein